ncbi:redoxin domain-containing protein [Methylobacterium sp. CB376]|uniref:redoxin domain-containing protein n=1 Tax=unclassified Methylobacterium TaxID=2615210 RepID=UPI00223F7C0B|nr:MULTISPECIES: redoxin domain-containing protein [Methylobacterium]WFT77811.1 redoxin domain-containing protein [Methylobacterium nodulans]
MYIPGDKTICPIGDIIIYILVYGLQYGTKYNSMTSLQASRTSAYGSSTVSASLGATAMPLKERLIGDPAAEICVQTFLKGEPITTLAKGRVYVVVFWAIWCAPCKAAIPHLTALQLRHPQVPVIGVAVDWTDLGEIAAFVRDQGDAIGYRIAADLPLSPGERQGTMGRTWCRAAYNTAVPTAFIIDCDGRIAWIGDPLESDDPLAAVVEGRWDLAAAREKLEAVLQRDKVRELRRLEETVERHLAAGDRTGLLQAYDAAFAADPGLEPLRGLDKFALLLATRHAAALDYARHLIGAVVVDQIEPLIRLGTMLAKAAEQGTPAPDRPPAAAFSTLVPLIYRFSTMLAEAAEQGTASPDWPPAAANLALSAFTRAEALFGEGTDTITRVILADTAARALLVVGRTAEAADRARAARALAPAAFALEPDIDLAATISQLDQLVAHCDAAAGRRDGATCRLDEA